MKKIIWLVIFIVYSPYIYAVHTLIFLSDTTTSDEINQLVTQAPLVCDLRPLPWLVLETPDIESLFTTTRGIRKRWSAQENITGYFAATPNDPLYSKQWHLANIGIPELWQLTQGDGVAIALLDSGVDPDHPDLKGQISFDEGYDFGDNDAYPYDNNGHGSAMAGLMVARCYNQQGGCGVAPQASIIPYKISGYEANKFLAADLACAIKAAADSYAKILSLSLVLETASQAVTDTLVYAKMKDKTIVAAAGNEGKSVAFPAYLPWVISVAASDKTGERLPFSNYGDALFITAPGIDLQTTLVGTDYTTQYTGTSAAAALVSGTLALLSAQYPTLTAQELITLLLTSSKYEKYQGFNKEYGFGYLHTPIPDDHNELQFYPTTTNVYRIGDTVSLELLITQIAKQEGDLYLHLNVPINNQGNRTGFFKVWHSIDTIAPIPYNYLFMSPYFFDNDVFLPLYGSSFALLGDGKIDKTLHLGVYELSAQLVMLNGIQRQTRKIVWLETQ